MNYPVHDVLATEIDLSNEAKVTVALWSSVTGATAPFAEGHADFGIDDAYGGFAYSVKLVRTAGTNGPFTCE